MCGCPLRVKANLQRGQQSCRMRYDHMDVPPVAPQVTRIELHNGRCACAKRFHAASLADMPPGTLFGHNTHALLAYLHHSHHVGVERLA